MARIRYISGYSGQDPLHFWLQWSGSVTFLVTVARILYIPGYSGQDPLVVVVVVVFVLLYHITENIPGYSGQDPLHPWLHWP